MANKLLLSLHAMASMINIKVLNYSSWMPMAAMLELCSQIPTRKAIMTQLGAQLVSKLPTLRCGAGVHGCIFLI